MANPMQLDEIWEVRYICSAVNQVSVNRMFYKVTNVVGQGASDVDFGNEKANQASPLYENVLGVGATYEGLSVQRAQPLPRTVAHVNTGGSTPGLVAGDLLPPQTCGLLSLKTNFAGKKTRGRKYIPFPSEGSNDPGATPSVAYKVAVQDMLLLFLTPDVVPGAGGLGVDEVTMTPVIWAPPAGVAYPVVSGLTKSAWATQRRRSLTTAADKLPF